MAFEGRSHVFPQALIFGARPLPLPGVGYVLCSSALLPFRLQDGVPVPPNDYFEAVSSVAGKDVAPDSMAPLPGSEVLVLGPVSPVVGDERRAELRCGDLHCQLLIRPDPEAPENPLWLGPEAALWHEQDNPWGCGSNDERHPRIVMANQPDRPVWLGPTSFLHPARARLMGSSDKMGAGGWPEDARLTALHEAHPAFWTESIHPGDSLNMSGFSAGSVDLKIPLFRPNLASLRAPDARWVSEVVRIHTVVLLPEADLGALIWRSYIKLGSKDPLGESVDALVFALEDITAPERDEQDLADIAVLRWTEPTAALDDSPLLPASMVEPPPATDLPAFNERYEAAEAWAREETRIGDLNPFKEPELAKDAATALDTDNPQPTTDLDAVANVGKRLMADSKRRHEKAGFPEPDLTQQREPVVRGEALEREINERLDAPFRAPQELAIAQSLAQAPPEAGADAEQTLSRLAGARIISMEPALFWQAMIPDEGEQFGAAALSRVSAMDPLPHIDISGAILAADPGDGVKRINGRSFDRFLAEETIWRSVEFHDCTFHQCSFVKSRFEDCAFTNCTFERVNFSSTTMENLAFRDCEISNQVLHQMNWINLHFENCQLKQVSFMDWAVRDTTFTGGFWEQVQVNESLAVSVAFQDMVHQEVLWATTHAPYTRFSQVRFFKVWVASMGFPESEFESVEAQTCGFLGGAYFNGSQFSNTRFTETGFTKATFNEARFDRDCAFSRCDFTSAVFMDARLANARFINCSMASTVWSDGVDASGVWFYGCILRGVDFMDTRLVNAVFTDADLEGVTMNDELTMGADFRGTISDS